MKLMGLLFSAAAVALMAAPAYADVPATVATFNSNDRDEIEINKYKTSAFGHTFNFDTSYDFVELSLDRTVTSEILEVSAARSRVAFRL